MKLPKFVKWASAASLLLGLSMSCSSKDDDVSAGDAAGTSSISSITELNLSGSLKLSVPASVSASGTSLALALSSKSQEACEIRQQVKEGMSSIKSVANMFCHIEQEPDLIPFGKKLQISITGEEQPQTMGMWVDNSKAGEGQITVYFCQDIDSGLSEQIVITGRNASGGIKGSVKSKGSETQGGVEQNWESDVVFDSGFTEAGRITMVNRQSFNKASDSFKRLLKLDLIESGVSKIFTTYNGSWDGQTFANRGAARIGDSFGMAIYNGKGTDPGTNQEYEYFHKAYFDSAGLVVGSSASDLFASTHAVTSEHIPKWLPATFDPADPTGWDCTGIEQEVTINMADPAKAEAHETCESNQGDFSQENCWGDAYEQSSENHSHDESLEKDFEADDGSAEE